MPPERFGAYLREFDAVLARHGRRGVYYGHFGDGCLHVRIDFDLLTQPGIAELPRVHGGRRRPRRRARRVAVGRARRRAGPRRAAAAHVPAGDHRGVRGVQGDLGPRRPDEPRPRRPLRPGWTRTCACSSGMPILADGEPQLAFGHDRGEFAGAHPPLPRRRQVRHRARRRDVPQLPGHGGGAALHPRPGAAAVRDGERRGDHAAGVRHDEVAEALDLCLSCKGCKTRLPRRAWTWRRTRPSSWPGATEGKVRPASALRDGRAAALAAPGGQAPGGRGRRAQRGWRRSRRWPASRSGPAASRRSGPIPPIAPRVVHRRSWRTASAAGSSRGRLLLWADTFTDHFDPEIAAAPSPSWSRWATPSSCRRTRCAAA